MSDVSDKNSRNGVQVIARAAAVLRALKADQSGMSLGQIAKAVSLPRSTVQRIVGALQDERLVITDAQGGGLRLGPEVSSLAEATRYNIVETCRLLLVELSEDTGETADLSVMRGAGMIFLDQVPGQHRLRTVSSVGEVFPLTTTANGQACLSRLDPEKAQRRIQEEWDRRGIKGDMTAIMERLEAIRQRGLAYDLNEHTPGICAVGFSFEDHVGDIHAISVPIPTSRFEEVCQNVEAALARAARNVETLMLRNR